MIKNSIGWQREIQIIIIISTSSSSLSHYSDNNICLYRRWIIVCTIYFFFSFQLQLEELGSSRLSFFKSIKIIIILAYITLTIIMILPSALHFIVSWLASIISSSISKIIPPSILLFLFFHFIVAILLPHPINFYTFSSSSIPL